MKIKNIKSKQILDSRGNPTVEVKLETSRGEFFASAPSGASKGMREALEIRDKDGKGVKTAMANIRKIAKFLCDKEFSSQQEIDKALIDLDGTENKSKLGVNAILPVSMAVCRAFATENKIPLYQYISQIYGLHATGYRLPLPCFNIIEGGAHAKNSLSIQEFLVIPQKQTFRENFIIASEIFSNIKNILGTDKMGDEGGFAPDMSKAEQALLAIRSAFGKHSDIKIGLDAAATQFFEEDKYFFEGAEKTKNEMLDFYEEIISEFPIAFIEDPFSEDDWVGFEEAVKKFSGKINIIGDDLLTTNIKRIKEAQSKNACTGAIIKPNQIGTVSETLEAAALAKTAGWKIIVSHRSGETKDDFIADLAVGIGADFIKAGSPLAEERLAKYNRILEIENQLLHG